MQLLHIVQLLVLMTLANGTPIVAKKIFGPRFSFPLDAGTVFLDGRPLVGRSRLSVGEHWYQGTADAIYQNLYSLGSEPCKYVLILSGDHVYKMNYQLMLQQHIEAGADVTIGTIEFDRAMASAVRGGGSR